VSTMNDNEKTKITPAVLFGIAFAAFFVVGYMLGSTGLLEANLEGNSTYIAQDRLPASKIGVKAIDYMKDHTEDSTTVRLINVSDSKIDGFYRVWLRLEKVDNGRTRHQKTKIYASEDGSYLMGHPINSSDEIKSLLSLD